jgi:HEPN domain-containing protein
MRIHLELALKAFIRSVNPEVEYGHTLEDLYAKCRASGLSLSYEEHIEIGNIVRALDAMNVDSGLRYFFGPGNWPHLEWTREVARRLIESVEPYVRRAENAQPSGLGQATGIRLIVDRPRKREAKT